MLPLLNQAGRETLVEYFQKTSLNGCGLLYYIRRRKYQRLFWFAFIMLGISFATCVVYYTVNAFWQNPTVTSLDSQSQPLSEIPFPGVSVCSANKLSRRAVEEYARELHSRAGRRNAGGRNLNYWLERMKLFAAYFEDDAVDLNAAVEFQSELDALLGKDFSVLDTLKRLAPSCKDLLIKCFWLNRPDDCKAMFELHPTPVGMCCIFNYQQAPGHESSMIYAKGSGTAMGLTVVLNTSKADYYFTSRNVHGFVAQVFDATDMPDASAGGCDEQFIAPGMDVDMALVVQAQIAAEEGRSYHFSRRHCFFKHERTLRFGLARSEAKCLADCKTDSIRKLCDCVPYYTPADLMQSNTSARGDVYCTLVNSGCLERYSIMWNKYKPLNLQLPTSLQKDMLQSIQCFGCLPACSYNRYYIRKLPAKLKDTLSLDETKVYLRNLTVSIADDGVSVVKFYLLKPDVIQYRKYVLYNWYQILSNIGGVIGISMGCSFITGIEVIYFMGFRFWQNLHKIRREMNP